MKLWGWIVLAIAMVLLAWLASYFAVGYFAVGMWNMSFRG